MVWRRVGFGYHFGYHLVQLGTVEDNKRCRCWVARWVFWVACGGRSCQYPGSDGGARLCAHYLDDVTAALAGTDRGDLVGGEGLAEPSGEGRSRRMTTVRSGAWSWSASAWRSFSTWGLISSARLYVRDGGQDRGRDHWARDHHVGKVITVCSRPVSSGGSWI